MVTNRELFQGFTKRYPGFDGGILLEVLMCSPHDSMAIDEDDVVKLDRHASQLDREWHECESRDDTEAAAQAAELEDRLGTYFNNFWRAIGYFRTSPLDKDFVDNPMGAILVFEGPVREVDAAGWFAVTTVFSQYLDAARGGLWGALHEAISYALRHKGGENDLDAYQALFPLGEKRTDCTPQVEAATALSTICLPERPEGFELVLSDPLGETFCVNPGELSSDCGIPSFGRLPDGGTPELTFLDGSSVSDYVNTIRQSLSQVELTRVEP